MNIQFEKLSARGSFIGANDLTRAPRHGADTRADLGSFDGPVRSGFAQTFIDILSIAAGIALAGATGIGIAFAIFVLLFVRT